MGHSCWMWDSTGHQKKKNTNIRGDEIWACKTLNQGHTLKILPANKGNTTVIDEKDHHAKLQSLITEDLYHWLNKYLTKAVEGRICQVLNSRSEPQKQKLTPQYTNPPIYEQPSKDSQTQYTSSTDY